MSNVNLVTFLDAAQRTIIAKLIEETAEILTVENPVVVNIVPQYDDASGRPSGQMALQLLPVYFREFQGEKRNPAIFKYPKTTITQINFEGGFDFRLYGQYENIFNAQSSAPKPQPNTPAPVLKLFEE